MGSLKNRLSCFAIIFIILGMAGSREVSGQVYRAVRSDSNGVVQEVTYKNSLMNGPENVLVVYNLNYRGDDNGNNIWDGYEIADFYKKMRNIPDENVFAIDAPTAATISRQEFDSNYGGQNSSPGIRQQIAAYLNSTYADDGILLRNKIKYIVLTKGIPYKISPLYGNEYLISDYSSVDAALVLIFNGDYEIKWRQNNPYYFQDHDFTGTSPFVPDFYKNFYGYRLNYLVTRLDGYRVEDVKKMILRSVAGDTTARDFAFIIDADQKLYGEMKPAYDRLKSLGAVVFPDPWEDTQEDILTYPDPVIAYVGNGIHAGLPADYILNLFDFKLANGAIFSSYESFNGASFDESISIGHGQVADFIKIGGSGGVGNVYEPYSSGICNEEVLFAAYYSGYTFAEAAYMSMRYIDWVNIVIGDPLMQIGPPIKPHIGSGFWITKTDPPFYLENQATSTVARLIFSDEIDSTRIPVFWYHPGLQLLHIRVDKNELYLWYDGKFNNDELIRFKSNSAIYSVSGDSLFQDYYAWFMTNLPGELSNPPLVYQIKPGGIEVSQDEKIEIVFSQEMLTNTIFPILGNYEIHQSHNWQDNRILTVDHDMLLPGTQYSFVIDVHAKSVDGQSFGKDISFNFVTEHTYIFNDIDGDGIDEFAQNNNQSLLDGYETYFDPGGVGTYVFDSLDWDNDQQKEFFIASIAINLPQFYWNPGSTPYFGYTCKLTPLDDDEDGEMEYAFDMQGKGYFTHVYDRNEEPSVRAVNFVMMDHSPVDGSIEVSIAPKIELSFTQPVIQNELYKNIVISDSIDLKNIQLKDNGRTIIAFLEKPLRYGSEYSVWVSNHIQSISNEELIHSYSFSFETADSAVLDPPRVTDFYPGDSLHIENNTSTVRFIFNSPMDTKFPDPVQNDSTSGIYWMNYWSNNRTLYLIPVDHLQKNRQYNFELNPDLKDTSGTKLSGKKYFNFIAGDAESDDQLPEVLSINPRGGSVIGITTPVSIIFSEWVNFNPSDWQTIENKQPLSWQITGGCLVKLNGDPLWLPQQKLTLNISRQSVNDDKNSLSQDYELSYYILGSENERDIDNDGYLEVVIDANKNLSDGFDLYIDNKGIISFPLFVGDIDNDHFSDFIISDSASSFITTWLPSVSDSGTLCFTELTGDSIAGVSVDGDNLLDYSVDLKNNRVVSVSPKIRKYIPENASTGIPRFKPVELFFNTRMNTSSISKAVQISPETEGAWLTDDSNAHFYYYPDEGWNSATIYQVKLKPAYQSILGVKGIDSVNFIFQTGSEVSQTGVISWSFPQAGDTLETQSDMFIMFSQAVDTGSFPDFTIFQGQDKFHVHQSWFADSVLQLHPLIALKKGLYVLKGSGSIRFSNSSPINLITEIPFSVDDKVPFKMIKNLSDFNRPMAIDGRFNFIFNQPLDTLDWDEGIYIADQNEIDSVDISLQHSAGVLTVIPKNLQYEHHYNVVLTENLKGSSGFTLSEQLIIPFYTMAELGIINKQIKWVQSDNYLILTCPLVDGGNFTYELYITKSINEIPDIVNKTNLFSKTLTPSWVLDLNDLPEMVSFSVRMHNQTSEIWAIPLSLINKKIIKEDLISLPLINGICLDNFNIQLQSVSQWCDTIPGWYTMSNSSDSLQWKQILKLSANSGVLAHCKKEGYLAWLFNKVDTLKFESKNYSRNVYRSFVNPYEKSPASALAGIFGNGTRVAVWNDDAQGWIEAVFDSVGQNWVNDFDIDYLTPLYVFAKEGISLRFSSGKIVENKRVPAAAKIAPDAINFPSNTILFDFQAKIQELRFELDGGDYDSFVGCGIDAKYNTAFVNYGNLQKFKTWKVKIIGENNELLKEIIGIDEDKNKNLLSTIFSLGNSYPNPFNSVTNVPIFTPAPGKIDIEIYNILGQRIIANQIIAPSAGRYLYRWQSRQSSGIYFIKVSFFGKILIKKMVLLK